jgi:hypothetical protein
MEAKLKTFTERDIVAFASKDSDGIDLKEEAIVLRSFKVNHAFGDKNPFERVKFYKSKAYDECYHKDMRTVSAITPNTF